MHKVKLRYRSLTEPRVYRTKTVEVQLVMNERGTILVPLVLEKAVEKLRQDIPDAQVIWMQGV